MSDIAKIKEQEASAKKYGSTVRKHGFFDLILYFVVLVKLWRSIETLRGGADQEERHVWSIE